MRGQALKGHLDLLLLATLSDGAKHGYAVIERLRDRSEDAFDLPEGTVYPALHRLEKGGLLSSDWSVVQSSNRRTYRTHGQGQRCVRRTASRLGRVLELRSPVSWQDPNGQLPPDRRLRRIAAYPRPLAPRCRRGRCRGRGPPLLDRRAVRGQRDRCRSCPARRPRALRRSRPRREGLCHGAEWRGRLTHEIDPDRGDVRHSERRPGSSSSGPGGWRACWSRDTTSRAVSHPSRTRSAPRPCSVRCP